MESKHTRLRWKRIEQGLCGRCGANGIDNAHSKSKCSVCLSRSRDWHKAAKAAKAAAAAAKAKAKKKPTRKRKAVRK